MYRLFVTLDIKSRIELDIECIFDFSIVSIAVWERELEHFQPEKRNICMYSLRIYSLM
jgi:hypothetical protein